MLRQLAAVRMRQAIRGVLGNGKGGIFRTEGVTGPTIQATNVHVTGLEHHIGANHRIGLAGRLIGELTPVRGSGSPVLTCDGAVVLPRVGGPREAVAMNVIRWGSLRALSLMVAPWVLIG